MCGIAGFAGLDRDTAVAAAELRAMCDAIRHRGPDDAGYFTRPGVALGMRRLSIIDLAGGMQPIGNEDGSIQVVFNGEIYNYRELRRDLVARGHRFRTESDTEVLVHLYEERGVALVHELRGMFGFALWDARTETLLLARDRLGIKPLYYAPVGNGIVFGSELKALLAHGSVAPRVDPAAIAWYLSLGYIPDPHAVFEGVFKLEPGHVLWWDAERGIRTERYWSPLVPENAGIDEAEAAAEIRRLLEESVRYRLIADVPLGAFLSGGVDSSAVVATMARLMDRPVSTFSIGFAEPEYNEAPAAAAVARALGTDHHELIVGPDVDDLFERVVGAFDEPFADASAIPTLLVSALARRHVTVVLSGDGGDELFGGYTRYAAYVRRNIEIPGPVRALLGYLARRAPQRMYGRNRLLELSRTARGRYTGMVAHALAVEEGGVAGPAVRKAAAGLDELLAPWFDQVVDRDPVSQAMLVDTMTYLPGDILTKVDRMSMAVSLEARVPLLDHRLVEFTASLPSSMKLDGNGQGKRIFRRAMRGIVPDFVFDRPKHGFSVPLRPWLKRELRHRLDALRTGDAPIREYIEPSAVERVIDEHLTGRRSHAGRLWRLVVLDLWLRGLESGRVHEDVADAVLSRVG